MLPSRLAVDLTFLDQDQVRPPRLHSRRRWRHMRAPMASTSLQSSARASPITAPIYRMLLLAAMAVVAGTGGAFSAWAAAQADRSRDERLLVIGNFSFAHGRSRSRGPFLVLLIPDRRRADRRADGAVWVREDPRPRHPRGDRDHPLRRKQAVAQGRAAEASVVGGLDRQRRAVRRRGADHHDRRRDRLAVRAAASG